MTAPWKMLGNEKGIALAIAIIFLFVLSILTAVLSSGAITEIVSSSRYRSGQEALYAAEAGVRSRLAWLESQASPPENSSAVPTWFSDAENGEAVTFSPVESVDGLHYSYSVRHLRDEPSVNDGQQSDKIGNSASGGSRLHFYRIEVVGTNAPGTVTKTVQVVTTVRY